MPSLTSTPRIVPFILSEAAGFRSRDNGIVTQSGTAVVSGTVVTKADNALTGSFAMDAGSTGNPTSGVITVSPTAAPGRYRIVFQSATTYQVEAPDGTVIDNGATGSAFSAGGLAFTLTAGGTAAVENDTAAITVAAGTGKFVPYTASGAAGPAGGISYNYLAAATGDVKCVIFTNDCEVNRALLTGLDAAAEADLAKLGIKVRGTAGLPTVSTPAL
jgi:hypothetical protein